MKHILIIPCLLLCSCLVEEEAEPENTPLSSPSSVVPSSSSDEPAELPSSSSVEPEPSILDCPPEDIAEYPIHEPPPVGWEDTILDGACASNIKVSKEELIFDAQGGVRCVTAEMSFRIIIGNNSGATESERACVGENVVDYYYYSTYTKLKCPWFTVTKVDDQVLHISVNKNEAGAERKMNVNITGGRCEGSTLITQLAD